MEEAMRALIVSADRFEDSELLDPLQRLMEEGVTVDVASLRKGPILGKKGHQVEANLALEEVVPEDYDLLLLPGGRAPARLRKEPKVLAVARRFLANGKLIAAICHGPQILISTGKMAGRTATAYRSVARELEEAGVSYVDQEVVVDGNLITARQPSDVPGFIRTILARLQKKP
jgi:protease I